MATTFDDMDLLAELTEEELAELNADLTETDTKDTSASLADEFEEFLAKPSPKKKAPVTVEVTPEPEDDEDDLDAFLNSPSSEFTHDPEEDNEDLDDDFVDDFMDDDLPEQEDTFSEEVEEEFEDLDETSLDDAVEVTDDSQVLTAEKAFDLAWENKDNNVSSFHENDTYENTLCDDEAVGDDLDEAIAAFEETDAALADVQVTLPDPVEGPEDRFVGEALMPNLPVMFQTELPEEPAPDEVPVEPEEESVDLQALFKAALDAQAEVTKEFNRQHQKHSDSRGVALSMFNYYTNNLFNALSTDTLLNLDQFKEQFDQVYTQLKQAQEEMEKLQHLASQAQFLQDYVMQVKASPSMVNVPVVQPEPKQKAPKAPKGGAVSLTDLQTDLVVKGKLVGGEAGRVRFIKIVSVDENGATGVYRGPGATWESNVAPVILDTVRLVENANE